MTVELDNKPLAVGTQVDVSQTISHVGLKEKTSKSIVVTGNDSIKIFNWGTEVKDSQGRRLVGIPEGEYSIYELYGSSINIDPLASPVIWKHRSDVG